MLVVSTHTCKTYSCKNIPYKMHRNRILSYHNKTTLIFPFVLICFLFSLAVLQARQSARGTPCILVAVENPGAGPGIPPGRRGGTCVFHRETCGSKQLLLPCPLLGVSFSYCWCFLLCACSEQILADNGILCTSAIRGR